MNDVVVGQDGKATMCELSRSEKKTSNFADNVFILHFCDLMLMEKHMGDKRPHTQHTFDSPTCQLIRCDVSLKLIDVHMRGGQSVKK